ncbi:forkhead domain-containing protein, partial [Colletotrichum tofieldiae]
MDPTRAPPASSDLNPPIFPQQPRLLSHHHDVDADQQVNPCCMPAQTCMPQHAFSGEPVSPQPAKAAGESSPSTDTKMDESGRKMTYAKLIQTALLSRETQQMELSELYDWFEKNTSRANRGNKGWQNSVRSNLSLNKAFQRLDGRGSYWRLVGAGLTARQPTRKPRANRREKVKVLPAERNSVASPTSSCASESGDVPRENVSEVRHGHSSPWSLDDSTSPEKSQLEGDPSSIYSTPSLVISTQDDLKYTHDPLWAWNLDSRRYVNWPYCSCFCSRHQLGWTDISGTLQLRASTPRFPPTLATAG